MKIVSAILGAIAKAVAWLLVKLGMWVPALYSLLFLVIAAMTKTKLSSVSGIYLIGLVITVVFALVFAFLSAFKKFKKKKDGIVANATTQASSPAPVKKEQTAVNLVEGAPAQAPVIQTGEQVAFSQPVQPQAQQNYYQPSGYYQPQPSAYPQYQPSPQQNFQSYQSPYSPERNEKAEFAPYINPSAPQETEETGRSTFEGFDASSERRFTRFGDSGREDFSTRRTDFTRLSADGSDSDRAIFGGRDSFLGGDRRRFSEEATPEMPEQPKIFRTRMNPDMLIYEYSDRLEFYKKTSAGLVLLSSEAKKK